MTDSIPAIILFGAMVAGAIPLILRRVPPNRIYGFRTAKTLADGAVWYPANVFAGWVLIVVAAVGLALLAAGAPSGVAVLAPLAGAVVACIVYLRRIPA